MLVAVREDPDRECSNGTPRQIGGAHKALFAGLGDNSADHPCMPIRSVQKPGSMAITSAVRGTYATDQRTPQEALSLITANR